MKTRTVLATVSFLLVASCGAGGGDEGEGVVTPTDAQVGGDEGVAGDNTGDDLGDAFGQGGGGTLIFDGEEFPIEGATCALFGETISVGTTSGSGHRVLVGTNGNNPISAQVLDPEMVQWFPQGTSGVDEAIQDGNTFRSDTMPYFNNADDRIVEVSFTIECP